MKKSTINVCPKCGHQHPRIRYYTFYKKPFSVHCDGCGFYQDGATKAEAIKNWNNATKETTLTARIRVDKFKDKKIIDTLVLPGSVCGNCQYRKELYGDAPVSPCFECGHLPYRDYPYFTESPVYEEAE